MAITSETDRVQYTLTTSNQTLAVSFYFLAAADLAVTKTVAGVDTTLTLTTHYTVSGAGNEAGGSITMVGGAADEIVTISRNVAFTQDTELTYQAAEASTTRERAYDRIVMQLQRINAVLKRTLRVPVSNGETSELTLNARKGAVPYFDPTTGALGLTTRQSIIDDATAGIDGAVAAAAASAAAAAVSETNAAGSATAAAGSATDADDSATVAQTAAASATADAGAAAVSATNASTHATNASTSATNAANSATSAASSASSASTSATNAATSATNADASATAANTSATNAAGSATAAAGSATAASGSAASASSSASSAATSATNASNSADDAAAVAPVEVASVAALRLLAEAAVSGGNPILLSGYYARGDFGPLRQGRWNASSTVADNGYTVFEITGVATGRFEFPFDGTGNVRHAGAKGDNSTDDTAAFNRAVAVTQDASDVAITVPTGDYLVTVGSLSIGTRVLTWHLDANATVNGNLIQDGGGNPRDDSTLLPGMTVLGGSLWRCKEVGDVVPVQVIRTSDPINFYANRAAFIVQQRDETNLTSGDGIDAAIMSFYSDGDGAVQSFGGDSWGTDSFWAGLRVQHYKTGGGSAHCHTVNGGLGAVGVIGAYNELGGYQGFLRNLGSTNGYLSGVEVRVSDSEDSAGLNARDTRMIGVLGGIEKYKAAATRYTHCFYAQSSGGEEVDTVLLADGSFRDGINLQHAPISRWSFLMRPVGNIGWQRPSDLNTDVANCNRIVQLSDRIVFIPGSDGSTYGFEMRDTVGNVNFAYTPSNSTTTIYKATITAAGGFIIATASAPATANASGPTGQITWDSDYVYVCVATNTWKRAAIATW